MRLGGIKLSVSKSRHPQTNGSSERMNCTLKNYHRCYISHHQRDSDSLLVTAELAYNSAKITNNQYFPFEFNLGWLPRAPFDFISSRSDVAAKSVASLRRRLASSYNDVFFLFA